MTLERDSIENKSDHDGTTQMTTVYRRIWQYVASFFSKGSAGKISSQPICQTPVRALAKQNNIKPNRDHLQEKTTEVLPTSIPCSKRRQQALDFNDQPPTKGRLLARLVSDASSSTRVYMIQSPRNRVRILKVSTNPGNLRKQFSLQSRIREALRAANDIFKQANAGITLPHIPATFSFYPTLSSSREGSTNSLHLPLPIISSLNLPKADAKIAAAYFMQFISPFQEGHARYLIRRHLRRHLHYNALASICEESYHFLGMLCLGANKPQSDSDNPDLHDRSVYVDHLITERVNVSSIAATMGATLAILHWKCGLDARGIKFLLGRDSGGRIRIWLVGFGDCSTFPRTRSAVTTQLTKAIMDYSVRWSRLLNNQHHQQHTGGLNKGLQQRREMWARFQLVYLEVSQFILHDKAHHVKYLPDLFLHSLETLRGQGQLFTMTAKRV